VKGVGVVGVVGDEELTRKDVEGLTFELHAIKFSKDPKFFLEKKCKKETKRRGLQGPVGLLHLTPRFFCSSPQWQTLY